MKKYIYYTPIELARTILAIVPKMEVDSIIDICCGSWNLLNAGEERYPNAFITGVDVDKESEKHKITKANFRVMDGREFANHEYTKGKTYGAVKKVP